jgi:thioredoxin 1
MRAYRLWGLIAVVCAVVAVVAFRVAESRGDRAPDEGADGPCCTLPPPAGGASAAVPKIPTGSGLPCLVEFGSDECDECKRMKVVLEEVKTDLQGRADLLQVDTDVHRGEAARFSLRVIPTQVLVGVDGKELWRHEGFIPTGELLAAVRKALEPHDEAQGR